MRKLKLLLTLCLVAIAASASKTVNLVPGPWDKDGARYAICQLTDPQKWFDFTDSDGDGTFSATIADDNAKIILCRMNGSTTENNWDNKWNQTADLAAPVVNGMTYTITSIDGSYSLSGNTVYLYNVGADKYMCSGNNWGSHVSVGEGGIPLTLEVGDGIYKISTASVYSGKHLEGEWMDGGGATNWTFSCVGDNLYKITDGTNYLYWNSGTLVSNGTDPNSEASQWKVFTEEERIAAMANATQSSPMNVTFLIKNYYFAKGNGRIVAKDADLTNSPSWKGTKLTDLWGHDSGDDQACYCAEQYNKQYDNYQELTVPNGKYFMTAKGFYRGSIVPYIYANSEKCNLKPKGDDVTNLETAAIAFRNGSYLLDGVTVIVTDGHLRVGVKCDATMDWSAFDDFSLTYYGVDLSALENALNEAIAKAQGFNGKIPTACYSELNSVVTANSGTYTTEADYNAAITAINNAIGTYAADAIVAAYSRYTTVRAGVLAVNSGIDLTEADALANAGTTTDYATAINNGVAKARTILGTYFENNPIADDDIDLTDALIDNAAPGMAGKLDYWTNEGATPSWQFNLYEFYNVEATSKQQIMTTLPAGYYKMTVVGFTREGNGAYMFADGNTHNLVQVAKATVNNREQGNNWIATGNGVNEFVFQLTAAEPDLEIGVYSSNTANNDKWTCWRSFKLEYLGTAPLVKFQNDLAAAVAIANDHATALGETIPAAAKNAYTNAINTAANTNSTIAECLQSIQDIEAATAAADACVKSYAAYNTLRTPVQALYDVADYEELTAGSHDALGTALNTAATNVAAAATAADIETVTETLKTASVTYVGAANPTGSAKFDLTYLLTNPNVDAFYTGAHGSKVDGWYTEQDGGNFQVVPGEGCANADNIHKHAYEYWSENPRNNDKFLLYQKVNLPGGTYSIQCYAFRDQSAANAGEITPAVDGVYFYANDTKGSCVTTNTLAEQGISFVNDAQQEVKIGLKAVSGNTYRWVGIGYMELYKVPAQSYDISEDAVYDTTQEGAGKVNLTRTIKADTWNTIWLPFSMTADELKATFGNDVAIATFSETVNENATNQSTINFNKMSAPAISPNVPVLLKTSNAGTNYTIEGRTVVAGTPQVAGTNFNFVGTTAASTPVATGDYFISSNKLYTSKGATTLKGTRAYLKTTATGARIVSLVIDGEDTTTAIENVENGTITTGKVYNLQGQEVKSAQKGIFIQNGKKVVLK